MIRLIVADDAPFIREIVRHVVEKADIQIVAEAADGQEAVAAALAHKPDVILMDIIMPKKTGIEATKEILIEWPEARIIAFSTADQDMMMMNALEAGCCSFLLKPFSGEDLVRTIKKSLEK